MISINWLIGTVREARIVRPSIKARQARMYTNATSAGSTLFIVPSYPVPPNWLSLLSPSTAITSVPSSGIDAVHAVGPARTPRRGGDPTRSPQPEHNLSQLVIRYTRSFVHKAIPSDRVDKILTSLTSEAAA